MQARNITYPSSLGGVVRTVRASVAVDWSPVTVQPKLPDTKTRRMVTVRDDGGTPRDGLSRRRHGFNIWADNPVDAERIAITVADTCRADLAALEVTDPLEVTDQDDDVMVVSGKTFTHYFVSAVLLVRATNR